MRPKPYTFSQKMRLWLLNPRAALFGRWIRKAVIANGGSLAGDEWPRRPWYLHQPRSHSATDEGES